MNRFSRPSLNRLFKLRFFKEEAGISGTISLALTLSIGLVVFTVYSSTIAPEIRQAQNIINILPSVEKGTDDTIGILECSMGEHLAYSSDFHYYRNLLQPVYREIVSTLPAGYDICLGIVGRPDPRFPNYQYVERPNQQSTEVFISNVFMITQNGSGEFRYLYGCDDTAVNLSSVRTWLHMEATQKCMTTSTIDPVTFNRSCSLKDIHIVGIPYYIFGGSAMPEISMAVFIAPGCSS